MEEEKFNSDFLYSVYSRDGESLGAQPWKITIVNCTHSVTLSKPLRRITSVWVSDERRYTWH